MYLAGRTQPTHGCCGCSRHVDSGATVGRADDPLADLGAHGGERVRRPQCRARREGLHLLLPSDHRGCRLRSTVGSLLDHRDDHASSRTGGQRSGDGQGCVRDVGRHAARRTGIVGLLFTFFYVNSFTTALRRVYTQGMAAASGRAGVGLRAGCGLSGRHRCISRAHRRSPRGSGKWSLDGRVRLAAWLGAIGLWWIAPWLMLQRQVRFRALSTSALLTGTGLAAVRRERNVVDAPHRRRESESVRILRCGACARDVVERSSHDHCRQRVHRSGPRRGRGLDWAVGARTEHVVAPRGWCATVPRGSAACADCCNALGIGRDEVTPSSSFSEPMSPERGEGENTHALQESETHGTSSRST